MYAYTLYRRTTKFDVVTHVGRVLVLVVSQAPPQGAGSHRSPIWGSLLFNAYTLCCTTKFDVVTLVEGARSTLRRNAVRV